MKLTARSILSAKLDPGDTDKIFFDDDLPGFGLRVRAGGSRSWAFQYQIGTKSRRMSLGPATPESFKSSRGQDGAPNLGIRERVMQLSLDVRHGKDPQAEKVESRSRASDTFEAIAADYLKAKKAETRPGTYQETERHILKHSRTLSGLQVASAPSEPTAGRSPRIASARPCRTFSHGPSAKASLRPTRLSARTRRRKPAGNGC